MDFKPKILIVDDHDINIELIEQYLLLENSNYIIFKATNGKETLKIVEEHNPDLILLDVLLPDINGYEICKKLKKVENRNLPVIMVTALQDRSSLIKGLEVGADEFLTKPVDRYELLVRVKNLLKVRKLTKDLYQRYRELKRELEMARILQEGFLPKDLPKIKELSTEVIYKPCIDVGGDFYDFLKINDYTLGAFIADVSGHGVSSAMITAVLKDIISKNSIYWDKPDVFLEKINIHLYHFFQTANSDKYITAFYIVMDLKNNSLKYSNGGHPPLININQNKLEKLDCDIGFPLGIFSNSKYQIKEKVFSRGDKIFMYTDGLANLDNFVLENELEKYSFNSSRVIATLQNIIIKKCPLEDDISLIALERV